MTLNDADIAGLPEIFHVRAKTYMRKATGASSDRDVIMFTAFASTLAYST